MAANKASADIINDPSNYDWNELNDHIRQSSTSSSSHPPTRAESSRKRSYNSRADTAPKASQSSPTTVKGFANTPDKPSNASSNSPTTEYKEFVNFVHAESGDQTLMRLSNLFVPIAQDGADTLIYIGTPPQSKDQTDYEYAHIKRQFELPYLVKSEILRVLGSAKFAELLGPKSARVQRKLQAAGIHKLIPNPGGIKYFVDLRPDIHDEEGLVLLTALSVPAGARNWHRDAKQFNISTSHVCGRDELDIPPPPTYRSALVNPEMENEEESQEGFALKDENNEGDTKAFANKHSKEAESHQKNLALYDLPQEDEYSQLRHHTGIARLLHAIAGNDPKLNSATKVWTFCMLAKFFDCAHHPSINRWITDWLVQSDNMNFVQLNPSTSYRMAMVTEAIWLVRSSFSIMVGQKAFASLAYEAGLPDAMRIIPPSQITAHLDDDEANRVDHAVEALVRRIKETFNTVGRKGSQWAKDPKMDSQLKKLYDLRFDNMEHQQILNNAKKALDSFARRLICLPLVEPAHQTHETETFVVPVGSGVFDDIPALPRLMTMQFWENLRHEDYTTDHADNNLSRADWASRTCMFVLDGIMTREEADIPYVSHSELNKAFNDLNVIPFYSEQDRMPTSPMKKVKFSPPTQFQRQSALTEDTSSAIEPISSSRVPPFPPGFEPRFPAGVPFNSARGTRPHCYKHQEHALLTNGSWECDSDCWDLDAHFSKTSVQDSDVDDDWEDAEMDPGSMTPTTSTPTQGLTVANPDVNYSSSIDNNMTMSTPITAFGQVDLPMREKTVAEQLRQLADTPNRQPQIGQKRNSSQGLLEPTTKLPLWKSVMDKASILINKKVEDATLAYEDQPANIPNQPDSPSGWIDEPYTPNASPFYIFILLNEIRNQVRTLALSMLCPTFLNDGMCAFDVPLTKIGTLVSLTEEEFKYLPLWAGGNDDGTGGVFIDGEEILEAPEVEYGGFRGGAMGIIPGVGSSLGGGSEAGSEFEDVATNEGVSTVGKASRIATDGEDTVISLDD